MKNNKSITLTIVANMTSNYGESLGNISSIQKVVVNGEVKGKRSKESLKNAIMEQSGFYDDVVVDVDGAAQKVSTEDVNLSNCRALEGGYMSTKGKMFKRNSSFYISDAISVDTFSNDYEFHNNLSLASKYAEQNKLSVAVDAKKCGLNPFNYEYSRSLVIYSITIDLEKIGVDKNLDINVSNEEKIERIVKLLETVRDLSLTVKGSLDNATPLFIIGGLTKIKTHVFEPFVKVKNNKLLVTNSLINKLKSNEFCDVAMVDEIFENDSEIKEKLDTTTIDEFFEELFENVREYYN